MNTFLIKIRNRYYHLLQLISSNPILVADLWRKRGIQIGKGTYIYRNVNIDTGNGAIRIGNNCVLTGCTILAHDASTNRLLGLRYGEPSICQPVTIEDDCFIGYGAIILMGVTIGRGSIVGAGAVVTQDVGDNCVVAGNPAKIICTVDELVQKRIKLIKEHPEFYPAGISKLTNE